MIEVPSKRLTLWFQPWVNLQRLTTLGFTRGNNQALMSIVFFICFFFSIHTEAQNPVIDSLLQKISASQRNYSDSFYQAGLIPSQRIYLKKKNYRKEDDNIFFTGLTVWTLRMHRSKLSESNKMLADSICKAGIKNYPRYRNRKGECSYNFWQTKPDRHFPNDSYFSVRKKYALADDLDDSAVLYLSEEHPDSSKKKLREKIMFHANGNNGKIIHNTFRRYKHRKAYSTWFGKKMPKEFDIAVQCNGLRWVLDNYTELNEYDLETIRLIQDMVLADEHMRYPHYVSPHYQNSAIILYHLARLVSAHPDKFPLIKEKLIGDLRKEFLKTKVPMEKLILNTSLARFGLPQEKMSPISEKDFQGFYFFHANMTSVYPNPIKRWMAGNKRTNFYYESPGYYWVLVLENECLK